MRPSPAFSRAIHSLAHPITILTILLLLFNDHWLRWNAPSWLTGKLGDFTWLIFAPFVAALLFSSLIPRRVKNQEIIVGILSFVTVGLWFALAKTVPFVHETTIAIWRTVIGWDGSLLMDSSDLLALPGLLVGYWIWGRADNQPFSLRPAGYIAFGLGILGTLATSPVRMPLDLWCIIEQREKLFVFTPTTSVGNSFVSTDGGFTWEELRDRPRLDPSEACATSYPFILSDPTDSDIQYRFSPGESIDRSTDGGQTWIRDIDLGFLRQEARRSFRNEESGSIFTSVPIGPFDAAIDDSTGNVVVSMGKDGILLRLPNGEWQWVQMGTYHLADIHRLDVIKTILDDELLWTCVLMLLLLASFLPTIDHWAKFLLLGISWFLWIVSVLNPPKKWSDANVVLMDVGGLLLYGTVFIIPIALILMLEFLLYGADYKTFWRRLRVVLFLALLSGGLFLLPYLLWTQGTIPLYSFASGMAILLAICSVITCRLYIKRHFPSPLKTNIEVSESTD